MNVIDKRERDKFVLLFDVTLDTFKQGFAEFSLKLSIFH